jgi:RNA 2',3'-cyclic 3'-phosphodiesterase
MIAFNRMRNRLFVALNLPLPVKEKLSQLASNYPELPAKWTKKENLHITLQFIGSTPEKEMEKISLYLKEAAGRHAKFDLKAKAVAYGPSRKNPRMIWALLEESSGLRELSEDISLGLSRAGFPHEATEFTPHITLARINQMRLRQMDLEERQAMEEELHLDFPVSSLELMDSKLRPGGSEYTIVQSFQLQ